MPTLIVESGAGDAGANVYEDRTDTLVRLDDQGFTALASLTGDTQKDALIIRGTSQINARMKARPFGLPLNPGQGLYFPRSWAGLAIPVEIKLASALQAECLALPLSGSSTSILSQLPIGVTEVQMSEDARFKVSASGIVSVQERDLKASIEDLLIAMFALEELAYPPVSILAF